MKNLIPQELTDRLIWKEPRANSAADDIQFPYVERIVPLPCEDCGKTLTKTRVVDSRRLQNPFPYINKVCRYCKKFAHPVTGEFCLENSELRTVLNTLKQQHDK